MGNSIFQLIPKIMSEVGAISKDRKNPQQGYSFRGIDEVYAAMQGPLSRHGVFYAPEVLSSTREERQTKSGGVLIYTVLHMKFTFYASDGSSFPVITVGEAMDSGDKSANKAMSAALKYALLQLFCVPIEGEDNDTENHSHEPAPKAPAKSAATRPIAPGFDPVVGFGKTFKGMHLSEIPEEKIRSFVSWLKDTAKKEGKPVAEHVLQLESDVENFYSQAQEDVPF